MEFQNRKEKVLLSILIPVYNVSKYISKCLDSILLQNEDDYEVILIDDGSDDNSGVICDSYSQKYSNVFTFHTTNNGVSSARNKALDYVRGKYVWFVDSDDYIRNDLSRILHELRNLNLDILLIDVAFVGSNGNILSNYKSPYKIKPSQIIDGKMCLESVLRSFYVWLFIFNADLIKNRRFNESLKIYEDLALLPFLIMDSKRVKYLQSSPIYFYVQRTDSALHSYNELYLDNTMQIILYFDGFIRSNSKYKSFYPIQLFLIRSLLMFLTMKGYSDRKKEFIILLKQNKYDQVYLSDTFLHRILSRFSQVNSQVNYRYVQSRNTH